VIVRYAVRVSGLTDIFLTKLDVLSDLETVPVCVGYEVDGKQVDEMPMTQTGFHHAKPVYEQLPGWSGDLSKARKLADLPAEARAYVEFIEQQAGCPVSAIGVGPGRDETVVLRDLV
jgi:adenylosuccinate synthase